MCQISTNAPPIGAHDPASTNRSATTGGVPGLPSVMSRRTFPTSKSYGPSVCPGVTSQPDRASSTTWRHRPHAAISGTPQPQPPHQGVTPPCIYPRPPCTTTPHCHQPVDKIPPSPLPLIQAGDSPLEGPQPFLWPLLGWDNPPSRAKQAEAALCGCPRPPSKRNQGKTTEKCQPGFCGQLSYKDAKKC